MNFLRHAGTCRSDSCLRAASASETEGRGTQSSCSKFAKSSIAVYASSPPEHSNGVTASPTRPPIAPATKQSFHLEQLAHSLPLQFDQPLLNRPLIQSPPLRNLASLVSSHC